MIETAAAGITADCLAKVSDFFSIGTNDLTQYTLGVDRENLNVAPLYNELHLSVLRLGGLGMLVSGCWQPYLAVYSLCS